MVKTPVTYKETLQGILEIHEIEKVVDVELGIYKPPPFYKVPEHMKNWEEDYTERRKHAKTRTQKIELCAWLVHRFLWIHPFFDYNGRVSRLIGALYLLQNKLPLVSFRAVRRVDFVKAVKEATQTGDLDLLMQLIEGRV